MKRMGNFAVNLLGLLAAQRDRVSEVAHRFAAIIY